MENEVKLTKLASCAGCGAKVGAGTLCNLLAGFRRIMILIFGRLR